MNKTQIEWVKNPNGTQGYTWNPITGCLNGCPYCYARKLANTRLRDRYLANNNIAPCGKDWTFPQQDPFYPRFWPEKLSLGNKKVGKGIFVCDMSDLFGIGVPEEWTWHVLDEISFHPQSRFYLLTKQPQNLQQFSPFPDNTWVGVSVTDSIQLSKAHYYLQEIEAKIKYLSFEPLLHRTLFNEADWLYEIDDIQGQKPTIDWVIIGAQTKPYNPPKIEWVEEITQAADKAGIPIFWKNNLIPLFKERYGNAEFYIKANRQEMPVNDSSS